MSSSKREVFFSSNPYKNQRKSEMDGKICQNMKFTPVVTRTFLPQYNYALGKDCAIYGFYTFC